MLGKLDNNAAAFILFHFFINIFIYDAFYFSLASHL